MGIPLVEVGPLSDLQMPDDNRPTRTFIINGCTVAGTFAEKRDDGVLNDIKQMLITSFVARTERESELDEPGNCRVDTAALL